MAYDFDTLQGACDHRQISERMAIEDDLRTLYNIETGKRMRSPINGRSTFILKFNGKIVDNNNPQYSWTIMDDNLLTGTKRSQKIVFNNEVRLTNVLIEIEYTTIQAYCRKCNGKGVVNDFKKLTTGTFNRIVKTRKLVQRCLKFVLTSKCTFYPQYTCGIKDYVGRKFGTQSLGVDDISYTIINSLSNLKKIQASQQNVQKLDAEEILRDITNLKVSQDPSAPTYLNVDLEVVNYTNEVADASISLKVI